MTKSGKALVAAGCLLVAPLVGAPAQAVSGATRADTPVHTLGVSGVDVASYPAYDPTIERYAVTTSDATGGELVVTASTADPEGRVYIDGALDADGAATVTGLSEGDEVSVFIVDSAGTSRHSLVYLPSGFPTLVGKAATTEPLTPGSLLLGLTNYTDSSNFFQTAVDRHGVPVYVEKFDNRVQGGLDLKQQPNGAFSISRTTTMPGRSGSALVQLDDEFQPISSTETVGLVNTDGHDSIALDDGTIWLLAYEPNDVTGLDDSIIQRIDPDGSVGFEWTSAPYADESVTGVDGSGQPIANLDYAHVNSIDLMDDGSLLASFRGLSSVFKIATSASGGHQVGDVIWKLGGVDSSFTFENAVGVPDGGQCAQHTARELDDGSILLFDNGAATPMCADPTDPTGPRVARPETRVLRLALDEVTGTAVIESSYRPNTFAQFAGSSQGLADGGTLIGWAFSRNEVASEIDADGTVLWRLRDPNPEPGQRYFSYRAALAEVPDVTAPTVTLDAPADGAALVQGDTVVASYTCHDRGGSSLQTCVGDLAADGLIDTSTPGRRTIAVSATDGAGLTTTDTRRYTVLPAARPDARIILKGTGSWIGDDVYGPAGSQQVRTSVQRVGATRVVRVRLENDGYAPDRLTWSVRGHRRGFGLDSAGLSGGTTRVLQPGQARTFTLEISRRRAADRGAVLKVRVPIRSTSDPTLRDAVKVVVVARGSGR